AAIPTLEEEDAKRPTRERENLLVGERTRIINRLKAAFARAGIRGFNPKLRRAPERLATLRTPEGQPATACFLSAPSRSRYSRCSAPLAKAWEWIGCSSPAPPKPAPTRCFAKAACSTNSSRPCRSADWPR